MDMDFSFGRWLQKRRKALDLTREEFAQKVGCSASTLRKLETEERRPSKQLAELLANNLEIPAEERATFIKIARGELSVWNLKSPLPLPNLGLLQSPQVFSNSIPIPPTPLIGRESELSVLRQMLANPQCRLITLVGPGGIGKTRLAVEVACDQYDKFENGTAFVQMAGLNSPSLIAPSMANALGLTIQGAIDPKRQLINHLRNKQVLLVLDNAEHLLGGVNLFSEIIESAPRVQILSTSRESLNLRSEWQFEVKGLPLPRSEEDAEFDKNSAVTLFLQRANQANPGFTLKDEDRAAILRICKMVEGIPLAIELSAVWTRTLSCHDIASEIEKSLDCLAMKMREIPEQQRSLRAVFDHSWKLLSDDERLVLMKLSVFRGGFTRDMVEDATETGLASLLALVSKSLIQRSGEKRYVLHEMVRQYAFAHLSLTDEIKHAYSAHLRVFVRLAETIEPELTRGSQSRWLMYMDTEYENFRTALSWAFESGDIESILRLTGALWRFWYMRSRLTEGSQWLEKALQIAGTTAPAVLLGKVLNGAGLLSYYQGNYDHAKRLLEDCLALQTGLGEHEVARAQLTLALVFHDQLDFKRASSLYNDTLQRFRQLNDDYGIIRALNAQGALALDIGDLDAADKFFAECLALARKCRDKENVAVALTNLGWTAAIRGDRKAIELCQEAVTLFIELGNKLGVAFSLEGVAAGFVIAGQVDRAVRLLGSARSLRKAIDASLGGTHARSLEIIIQQAHSALSDSDFAIAWMEGESMPMEQAIMVAIGLSDLIEDHPDFNIEAHKASMK